MTSSLKIAESEASDSTRETQQTFHARPQHPPTKYPEAMGGGASSLPEETQMALSDETRAAIEGLSEEAKREIVTIAGLMELAPAAVESSTPQATAPVVDENAAIFVPAAGAVAEEKEVGVKGCALHPAVAEKEDKEEATGHTAGVLEEEQCVEESEDGPMRAGAPDPGARELARMTMRL